VRRQVATLLAGAGGAGFAEGGAAAALRCTNTVLHARTHQPHFWAHGSLDNPTQLLCEL